MIHTKHLLIALGITVLGMIGFGAYMTFAKTGDVAAYTEVIFVSNAATVSEVIVETPERPENIWDSLMPQLEAWYKNRPPEPEAVYTPPATVYEQQPYVPPQTNPNIPDWVEHPEAYEQVMQYVPPSTTTPGTAAEETTSTSTRTTATSTEA